MTTKVEEVLKSDKLDAIVCVAGGWAGGNAASDGMNIRYCAHRLSLAVTGCMQAW